MMHNLTYLTVSFICLAVASADTHPDNFMFSFDKDLKKFGVFRNKRNVDTKHKNNKKSTSTGTDASVNVNDDAGDYEAAEEKIFRAIENVERKIVDTAEHLVLDEVDILFGKDHGHAIHDERKISIEDSNESESFRGRRGSRMIPSIPFTRKKATVDVKASSGEKKKEQLKHSALVDLLDSYAESCNQRPDFF